MEQTLIWTEKYQPTKLNDLIVNKDKIMEIKDWLEKFDNRSSEQNLERTIIISGSHGIGKNISLNILLKELNYTVKTLSSNNIKNKKIISDIIQSCHKKHNIYHILKNETDTNNIKFALLIDDTETITQTSEKDSLLELCKMNDKLGIMPIIFI